MLPSGLLLKRHVRLARSARCGRMDSGMCPVVRAVRATEPSGLPLMGRPFPPQWPEVARIDSRGVSRNHTVPSEWSPPVADG